MAVVPLNCALTGRADWCLDAFQQRVAPGGWSAFLVYLAMTLALPAFAFMGLCRWFTGGLRRRAVDGIAVGALFGVYVTWTLLALPYFSEDVCFPGMAVALQFRGDGRLAVIWAVALIVNVVTYAAAGFVGVWLLSRPVARAMFSFRRSSGQGANSGGVATVRRAAAASTVTFLLMVSCLARPYSSGMGLPGLLAQFNLVHNIRYNAAVPFAPARGTDLRMDVCTPAGVNGPWPVVVCVHGGGWHGGTRKEYVPLIVELATRGYAAATIDYRLAPTYRWPAQIDDVRQAVQWLRANHARFGIDPSRVAALGWSAGGHLVDMLGAQADEDMSGAVNDATWQSFRVDGVISFSGISDLTAEYWTELPSGACRLLPEGSCKDPTERRRVSPIAYIESGAPPFLLLHGSADPIVPPDQSRRLFTRLREADVEATLEIFPGVRHRWYGAAARAANQKVYAFLEAHLNRQANARTERQPAPGAGEDGERPG